MTAFDYSEAFSRNQGLIAPRLQKKLQSACVAVAGMGGVGGFYLSALARSGVGKFKIADFDEYELANFNRQYGASMSTVGRKKVDVMAEMLRDINPEIEIEVFSEGVTHENLDQFLDGATIVIDAIDLFVPDWHRILTNSAVSRGLVVLAAVPVGYGAGMVAFSSSGSSFDDYFSWDDSLSAEEKILRLALGFAPAGFHTKYIDPTTVSLTEKRGPSSVAGCMLCGGLVATQVIMAIDDDTEIITAPNYCHIDLRFCRVKRGKLRWGNSGLLQRLKMAIAKKKYLE